MNERTDKGLVTRYRPGVLAACCVPWDAHENLLEPVFRNHIRTVLDRGFRDVYIFGTAGEGYAVDTYRFERTINIFAEETAREGVIAQVGVIALSTAQVIERLRMAYQAGFRVFQISLPSWGAVDDEEMLRFFTSVCGTFPDCQFLHYNLSRPKRVLTGRDYRRLADEIPNLAATKITSSSVYDPIEIMRWAPELQHFFLEQIYPIGALFGSCSLLSSVGPLFPKKTFELYELGSRRSYGPLFELWQTYMTASQEIFAPVAETNRMDGAYDKICARMIDPQMPLRLLSPYGGFDELEFEQCRAIAYGQYASWINP